jgi:hypothetical protein
MRPSADQHEAFLAGQNLPGVIFRLNAAVEIISGEHQGQLGSVIGVEDLGANPLLLIELGDGNDALISQSSLRAAQ